MRGIEALLNDAQQAALERLSAGPGVDLEQATVEQMNAYIAESEAALGELFLSLLARTRSPIRTVGRRVDVPPRAAIPEERVMAEAGPPPALPAAEEHRAGGAAPSLLGRLLGGGSASAEAGQDNAMAEYERELERWSARAAGIRARLEEEQDRRILEAERLNAAVAESEARLASGPMKNLQTPIVETVNEMLQPKDAAAVPTPLPKSISVQIDEDERRVLIEARMPGLEVVPPRQFVSTGDLFPRVEPRSDEQSTELYRTYLAAVALATLNAVYTGDVGAQVRTAAFNGFVREDQPRPGQEREIFIVSLTATREELAPASAGVSDPLVVLKRLGGAVTRDAIIMDPVEPVRGARSARR